MRQAVADAFWNFTAGKEGYLDYMYTDVKNLVTTGIGNLIDPVETALGLRWRHRANGSLATQSEIRDTWQKVKSRTDLSPKGGGAQKKFFDAMGIDLYLEPEDIKTLVQQRLENNENILRRDFPGYDAWPADAQLGLHSMAWAMGAAFAKKFPSFTKAANALPPDFVKASAESHIAGLNKDRQDADKELFLKAAEVVAQNLDPSILYYEGIADLVKGAQAVGTAAGAAGKGYIKGAKKFPYATAALGIGVGTGIAWAIHEYLKGR